MSLHETVSAERVHIAFFGRRNAGKSSLVNAVTAQALSVVSDVPGTTTDPVKKAMELLPIGPVLIIDTPGFDDEGALGEKRVAKTREVLAKTDIAVLVVDAVRGIGDAEKEFLALTKEKGTPTLTVWSKADLAETRADALCTSAVTGEGIDALKKALGDLAKQKENPRRIVGDLIEAGDTVVLVTPIDASAPKGRLILPQQQTIRDILDAGAIALVTQPEQIPLTSFSILFARYKGELLTQVRGAAALSALHDGDRVLISEGCTHHRQCGDIGTVKMPAWIESFLGASVEYTFTAGGEFPDDLSPYALVVHCGGCMLNEAEMRHRVAAASAAGVPVVNYGVAIAHMHGILRRSLTLFPDALAILP